MIQKNEIRRTIKIVFLTYFNIEQNSTFIKETALKKFKEKKIHIKDYLIGEEINTDGVRCLHCYLCLYTKVNLSDLNYLDLTFNSVHYRPSVQPRGRKRNIIAFILEKSNYITNIPVKKTPQKMIQKDSVRITSKTIFLTYFNIEQNFTFIKESTLQQFEEKKFPIKYYLIGEEINTDGERRLHCYLCLYTRVNLSDLNRLDLTFSGVQHSPTFQTAVKKRNIIAFILEKRNYITNIPVKKDTALKPPFWIL